jgi:hypothetical protein
VQATNGQEVLKCGTDLIFIPFDSSGRRCVGEVAPLARLLDKRLPSLAFMARCCRVLVLPDWGGERVASVCARCMGAGSWGVSRGQGERRASRGCK